MTTDLSPVCVRCDATYPRLDTVDGLFLCWQCLFRCDHCDGEYLRTGSHYHVVPTTDLRESDTTRVYTSGGIAHVCDTCASDAFDCARCCETFVSEALDGDGHCDDCAAAIEQEEEDEREALRTAAISSYHDTARKRATRLRVSEWTERHNRWFGVELEAECGSRVDMLTAARAVLDAAHPEGWEGEPLTSRVLFCERDGSLDHGFEMITQPMGLDAQRELWERVLNSRAVRALRSHDTTTCGVHVHVSRAGLSSLTVAKAVVFLNADDNDRFITLLARRSGNGYCKKKMAEKVRGSLRTSWDRYERLNLTNSHTVEFRIFRGTTNYRTLLGSVEFAHAVLQFCAQASASQLTVEAFVAWLYRPEQKADTVELRHLIARRLDGPTRSRIAHLIPAHKAKPITTPAGV